MTMSNLRRHCNNSFWNTTFGQFQGKKTHNLVVFNMWREIRLETTKRLIVEHRGDCASQRVQKHMQHLNSWPMRKFDQCFEVVSQKDGNIVMDLGRESRKISQTACVNSQEWIRNTPWKSKQGHLIKVRKAKTRKGSKK